MAWPPHVTKQKARSEILFGSRRKQVLVQLCQVVDLQVSIIEGRSCNSSACWLKKIALAILFCSPLNRRATTSFACENTFGNVLARPTPSSAVPFNFRLLDVLFALAKLTSPFFSYLLRLLYSQWSTSSARYRNIILSIGRSSWFLTKENCKLSVHRVINKSGLLL